jgi:hypothetical protein
MTEDAPKKRPLISKRLAGAFRDILKEVGRPVEIGEIGVMAAERGHNTDQGGKNFYILAKREESDFVVDSYPSYRLKVHTKLPVFDDIERGVKYPTAAAKFLIGVRDFVGLMEIVRGITERRLYAFPVDYPEYWMYFYLNGYKEHFARRGSLRIGLREWRRPTVSAAGAQGELWEGMSRASSAKAVGDVTPKMHEANLETIVVEHLGLIEEGLKLVKRQYVCTGVGRIDVLCEDRHGNLVVIELKKFGVRHDSIIDQVTRYMGFIKARVAKGGQGVRGILVVASADERLRYAVAAIPGVEVRTFNLTIGPA